MSDTEVETLRRDIEALSRKTDAQHAVTQRRIEESGARYRALEGKVDELRSATRESELLLKVAVGSGQPGEGRLGALENAVEILKKFHWQALAILALILLAAEHSGLLAGWVRK